MRLISVRTATKMLALATLGFVLGLLGISAYEGKSLSAVLSSWTQPDYGTFALARSCIPEEKSQTDDIFFLSCGGIF